MGLIGAFWQRSYSSVFWVRLCGLLHATNRVADANETDSVVERRGGVKERSEIPLARSDYPQRLRVRDLPRPAEKEQTKQQENDND